MGSTITQRVRVGVIGLSTQGWASWGLVPPMLQLKDGPYEIAAICVSKPKSPEQQEVLRSKYGRDLKFYSSPQEMAQAPDLDLIVVSVRAPGHEKSVMPALDPGLAKKKDIFIEWPACGNLKSCVLMAKKANQLGVRVMVGLQGRQSPVLKKVSAGHLHLHLHIHIFFFSCQHVT
jgi:predicted dehydrogenase